MEKVLYYLARDNKKFYSESACKLYDAKKAIEERGLIFWKWGLDREEGSPMITDLDDLRYANWCYFPENAEPFDKETCEEIKEIWNAYPPNEPGIYRLDCTRLRYFDDNGEREWTNVEKRADKLCEEIAEIHCATYNVKETLINGGLLNEQTD